MYSNLHVKYDIETKLYPHQEVLSTDELSFINYRCFG